MLASYIQAKKDEDGFTLIELLVVVIIIGILAAIAIPVFLNQRENAWQGELTSTVRNVAIDVESLATTEGGDYSAIADAADIPGLIQGLADDVQGAAADPVVMVTKASDFGTTSFIICGEHTQLTGSDGREGRVIYDSSQGGIQAFEAGETC